MEQERIKKPKVYFSKRDSIECLYELYESLGRKLGVEIFVLVDDEFKKVVLIDEFVEFLGADRLEGEGVHEKEISVGFYGNLQGVNFIKEELTDFNSGLIISCFNRKKGEIGGAIDSLSLGLASRGGVTWIKSAGFTKDKDVMFSHTENDFRFAESKVEAGKSVVDYFGRANFVYMNIICGAGKVLGIVSGVDPVAIDKASFDILINSERAVEYFTDEDDTNEMKHVLDYAVKVGLGKQEYNMIEI